MVSDITRHQAKSVGDGNWVVSYLPGRTLTTPQSVAALRAAEEARRIMDAVGPLAAQVGLTALEAIGLAAAGCDWPRPTTRESRRRVRIRLWVK
jgi:hypothetical protein